MVIIWIEIYRFLSPFVRDGEERRGGKHQDQGSRENESFPPPPTEIVLDQGLEVIVAREMKGALYLFRVMAAHHLVSA